MDRPSFSCSTSLEIFQSQLARMNPCQKKAVEAGGYVLISAGAGTGKTGVLTLHFASLVHHHGIRPEQIMAVTFTNKACQEMRGRLERLLAMPLKSFWIGTFHGLCLRILKSHPESIGRRPGFTILDTKDQSRLIGKILKDLGGKTHHSPSYVLNIISQWKQQEVLPGQVKHFHDPLVAMAYTRYQEELFEMNSLDFDDLLSSCLYLFSQNPEILALYQKQFRHILVDEYQDINAVQYKWLKFLAVQCEGLFCVGDEDQSIYGWRGADVQNMLRFQQDFPGSAVLRLEDNYRSTPHILSAASHLIAHNQSRYGKVLRTAQNYGEKVHIQGLWDTQEEALFVADCILKAKAQGRRLCEIAILMRTSAQSREFEERFLVCRIPYHIIGNINFYERQEIRDFLGYIRLVHNDCDNLAFERIINVPKRGLGSMSLEKIHTYAKLHGVSLEEGARLLSQEQKVSPQLVLFLSQVKKWRQQASALSPMNLALEILHSSGYQTALEAQGIEGQARLDNVKELVQAMEPFHSLEEFLEHVGLLLEIRSNPGEESVTLMTLHSAKGLEFDEVFLPGWEENLFPHSRCLEDSGNKGLEEERRLAYVGITRARQKSTISFCWNRKTYHGTVSSSPSRFIQEIPGKDTVIHLSLDKKVKKEQAYLSKSTQGPQFSSSAQSSFYSKSGSESNLQSGFQAGQRVRHEVFGLATVIHQNGDQVKVRFDQSGEKILISRFLKNAVFLMTTFLGMI